MSAAGLSPARRRPAAAALLLARTVYAFNWYNVGAVLPLVGQTLGASTAELGIVLGAFLAGAGIFQVPAGLAALRWGNRAVSIAALAVMGACCLASAAAPSWPVLAALRFGAGAGAAFFFAPALGLFASYYPEGHRGPRVGLFNSGFSVGSGVGLFAGAAIGVEFGWPWALAIGGAMLLLLAAIAPRLLPRVDRAPAGARPSGAWRAARPVLGSPAVWALALASTGLWAAFYEAAQYFVQFAHAVHPGWSLALAAGLPTLMIVFEIPSGPFGGWLGERGVGLRPLLLGTGIATVGLVLAIPWLPIAGMLVVFPLLGVLDGVMWAVIYLLPTYLPDTRGSGVSLGLGLLNAINIFGGSGLAIAFGFIAGTAGFPAAWLFAGIAAAAPLPLLLGFRDPRPPAEPARRALRPGAATDAAPAESRRA